ncbi:acetyl-CoA carboxylase biotin carboxyl carrier protein [uncultured Intestinimonas sp.]|uniref:acetyl-CoA carboxylase biotin carboxyl carrier protein n=1 Tax=uncultured Intestinimonas sp. TaxID=1689265 RepID=UPI0025DCB9D2|nr:acetyl-CoA carboxylase biotin carboxyl carrier protein [uncultured Intestinimonas sp.]
MELSDILTLLDRFDASSAASMKLRLGDLRLELNKAAVPAAVVAGVAAAPAAVPVPAPAAEAPEAQPEDATVKAPLVGTFYAASAPGEAPFVSVGDTVKKGQTLCVLEAMKMMSEVPAPCNCVILEILAKDGDLVGFDAPLFQIREL